MHSSFLLQLKSKIFSVNKNWRKYTSNLLTCDFRAFSIQHCVSELLLPLSNTVRAITMRLHILSICFPCDYFVLSVFPNNAFAWLSNCIVLLIKTRRQSYLWRVRRTHVDTLLQLYSPVNIMAGGSKTSLPSMFFLCQKQWNWIRPTIKCEVGGERTFCSKVISSVKQPNKGALWNVDILSRQAAQF